MPAYAACHALPPFHADLLVMVIAVTSPVRAAQLSFRPSTGRLGYRRHGIDRRPSVRLDKVPRIRQVQSACRIRECASPTAASTDPLRAKEHHAPTGAAHASAAAQSRPDCRPHAPPTPVFRGPAPTVRGHLRVKNRPGSKKARCRAPAALLSTRAARASNYDSNILLKHEKMP